MSRKPRGADRFMPLIWCFLILFNVVACGVGVVACVRDAPPAPERPWHYATRNAFDALLMLLAIGWWRAKP